METAYLRFIFFSFLDWIPLEGCHGYNYCDFDAFYSEFSHKAMPGKMIIKKSQKNDENVTFEGVNHVKSSQIPRKRTSRPRKHVL